MNIVLRRAEPKDKEKVIWVESKSTPNLRYLPKVFEMFASDMIGEFSVEEIDGELVACGKYTVLPDGTVWLEALRPIRDRLLEESFKLPGIIGFDAIYSVKAFRFLQDLC